MKKLLALLLAFIMVLGLAACGADANKEEKADPLAGKWNGEFDLTEAMEEMMAQALGESSFLPKDTKLLMYPWIEFKADGTYELNLDGTKTKASVDAYLEALAPNLVDYLYDTAEKNNMSKEDFEDAVESQYGCSVEEYVDDLIEKIDLNALTEMESEKGYYKKAEDKIYFATLKEELDASETYITYTLSGNTLKITGAENDALELEQLEELGITLPQTFTKG